MRSILVIFIAAIAYTTATAQVHETGAVKKIKSNLRVLHGSQKVDALVQLADEYFNQGFFWDGDTRSDSMLKYGQLAKDLATSFNYKRGEEDANAMIAFALKLGRSSQKGLEVAEQVIRNSKASTHMMAHAHSVMGVVYFEGKDDAQNALKHYKESLRLFEQAKLPQDAATAHEAIGIVYYAIGDFFNAIDHLKTCLAYGRSHMNPRELTSWPTKLYLNCLYRLTELYTAANLYNSAKEMVKEAEAYHKIINSQITIENYWIPIYVAEKKKDSAIYYMRLHETHQGGNKVYAARLIGPGFSELGMYREALPYKKLMIDSFRTRFKRNGNLMPLQNLVETLSGTAADYLRLHLSDSARLLALEAIHYYPQVKKRYPDQKQATILTQIFESLGQYDSALYYQRRLSHLKDSSVDSRVVLQLTNIERQLEQEKASSAIALLQKDNELKEQRLREQQLLQDQKQSQILLLDQENKLQLQKLAQASLKERQKEDSLALLHKTAEIKEAYLNQQLSLRNSLFAGLGVIVIISLVVMRNLRLKQNNERLQREQAENTLKLQQLENGKKQAELREQATKLEMQALRAQMNPHFIFNCLSSINWLILANNTEAASDYLTRFSRLIRQVLMNSEKSTISLEDELKTLRLYLEMEQLRFEKSFQFTIDVDERIEPASVAVPPLLVQPFCENAIRHGLMHMQGPGNLNISVHEEQGYLFFTIKDNGVGRQKSGELNGNNKYPSMGLKITSGRLATFNQNPEAKSFDIEDLIGPDGEPAGTKVTIRVKATSAEPVDTLLLHQ